MQLLYGFYSRDQSYLPGEAYRTYLNDSDGDNRLGVVTPNLLFLTKTPSMTVTWDMLHTTYLNKTLTIQSSRASCFPTSTYLNLGYYKSAWIYMPSRATTKTVVLPFKRGHTEGWRDTTFYATNILSKDATGMTGPELDAAIMNLIAELGLVKSIDVKRSLEDGGPQDIPILDYAIHVHVDSIDSQGTTCQTFSIVPHKARTTIQSNGWDTSIDYEIPYLVVFEINPGHCLVTAMTGFEIGIAIQDGPFI